MIVCLSDVSVGAGSPQIPRLAASLADLKNDSALILEPDNPDLPPRHHLFSNLDIERIYTQDPVYDSVSARAEYVRQAASIINRVRPQTLVICSSFTFPVLFFLRKKPETVIYYALEPTVLYGSTDVAAVRCRKDWVDHLIYPEEYRAAHDIDRCWLDDIPFSILYNCSADKSNAEFVKPLEQRNGRVIYQGSIDRRTLLLNGDVTNQVPTQEFDYYGPLITGTQFQSFGFSDNCRYMGYVDNHTLRELRREYSFSFCGWPESNEGTRFACANKFYEAISDGVPPITTPHPQHLRIINKFDCGIATADWSRESIVESIRVARDMRESTEYASMVDGCKNALRELLGWEHQFERLSDELRVSGALQ